MARVTRIALDIALVSVTKLRPTVSKLWGVAKAIVVKTPARPLVCNTVVNKVEITIDKIADLLESSITTLLNKQLPREEKYLQKELDKVRQRIAATSKAVRPGIGRAWQYAKTEMVPPSTLGFFHGPGGKKFEDSVAKSVDGFIAGLENKVKDMDASALKAQQDKEAAIKAAQDKVKAEAKAKADEEKRVAEAAKAEAKAKEEAKKSEEPKKDEKKAAKN